MDASDSQAEIQSEARRPWQYAFLILVLVSISMLTLRLMNLAFLAIDFEVTLVYLPTALAGGIVLYLSRKQERTM